MKSYAAHADLIAPAHDSAGLPRLFLGVFTIIIASVAFSASLGKLLYGLPNGEALGAEIASGQTARGIVIVLLSFGANVAALWVAIRLVHQRGMRSLFGNTAVAVSQFFKVFWVSLGLIGLILLIPMPEPMQPVIHSPLQEWLIWLPLGLGAILLQVTTEELLFRGYLQSQLAARFRHPVIWMGLPSVVFGLLHYQPGLFGEAAWWVVAWSTLFGLIAADLTARSGTLGPAIALHFVSNVSAILILSMKDHWDSLALLTTGYGPADIETILRVVPFELMTLFCLWLVARNALRR